MAELGWGFLGMDQSEVMILHVVGVYHHHRLNIFIKAFANVILADVGPSSLGYHSNSSFADIPLIEWASADPARDDEAQENRPWVTLRCSQVDSIGKIRAYLLEGLANQDDPISLRQLEKSLAHSSNKVLAQLRGFERRARATWRESQNKLDARDLGRAVEKLNLNNLGVEHLWRELSHLYVAEPRSRKYDNFPALAAQHLIDGLTLELMDGDAAMMNVEWVKAVMKVLKEILQKQPSSTSRPCRLLVLSIVGPQSSGKSTLLNVMFGVRLKTSVSQTTRGVNLQLLPCHGRGNYDFVLLIDTEGLRAPENIGLEDSVWRDNRMATFAILPADATIVLTLGESTTEINKILPIVLSAYLDSELAQKMGGYLSPKLFFVFNQIDLSQAHKMETIFDKLLDQLKENASIVEKTRAGVSDDEADGEQSEGPVRASSSSLPSRYFKDFKYDVKDEKRNDVRIFGRIKHGDFPPGDVPNPDFGHRVLKLREHIDRRVCHSGWEPRDPVQFGTFLELVWKCVLTSNFQFDFVDAMQRRNFDVMVRRFTDIVQSLSALYDQKFDEVCRKVNKDKDEMEENNLDHGFEARSDQYLTSLRIATQGNINELDEKIHGMFADDRYSKWRLQSKKNGIGRKKISPFTGSVCSLNR
ncbi:hypothetical protein R1sor_011451 [Riccia sorocarpa]|uniref:VLIG-type G domain-containing protein n=1 Tax=Riccia sorocarpa TaxID=122646 RepID=A0ABD3I4L1_9MARC